MDSKHAKKQTPEEIDKLMRMHSQAPISSPTSRKPEFHPREKPDLWTLRHQFPIAAPHYPDDYLDSADPSIQAYADSDAFRRLRRHTPDETVAPDPPIETVTPQTANEYSSRPKWTPSMSRNRRRKK